MRTLLELGRGKYDNILLVGPANCGKTFVLNPFTEIYGTFLNPSSSKYAFDGAENKELILLNYLKWSQEKMPWQEFLNLLVNQSVHLAAPKTHYARDILILDDVPIFANSIAQLCLQERVPMLKGGMPWWRQGDRSFSCLFRFHCLKRKLSRAAQDASVNLYSWELMLKALSQLLSPFWLSILSHTLYFNCFININLIYIPSLLENTNWVVSWRKAFELLKCF